MFAKVVQSTKSNFLFDNRIFFFFFIPGQTWKMVKSYYSDIVLSSFYIREPKIGLFKYLMSFNMSALTSLNTGKELNDNSYHFLDHIVSQSYHPHKSHNANPTTYGAAHHYGKTTHRCGDTAFRQSDTAHYHSDTAHHHRDPANHHGDDTKYQHRSRVHHDSYKTHHAGMATHSSGGTAQTHQHSDKTHKHSDTTHKHSDTNHQHCDTKHQHGHKTHQDSHTTHHSSIATQSTYSYKNGHKDSDATETGQNKTLYPSRKETGVWWEDRVYKEHGLDDCQENERLPSTVQLVFRDHSKEVMKVVSNNKWSLNASSIWLDLRRVAVSEQWSLKAGGLLTPYQTTKF